MTKALSTRGKSRGPNSDVDQSSSPNHAEGCCGIGATEAQFPASEPGPKTSATNEPRCTPPLRDPLLTFVIATTDLDAVQKTPSLAYFLCMLQIMAQVDAFLLNPTAENRSVPCATEPGHAIQNSEERRYLECLASWVFFVRSLVPIEPYQAKYQTGLPRLRRKPETAECCHCINHRVRAALATRPMMFRC